MLPPPSRPVSPAWPPRGESVLGRGLRGRGCWGRTRVGGPGRCAPAGVLATLGTGTAVVTSPLPFTFSQGAPCGMACATQWFDSDTVVGGSGVASLDSWRISGLAGDLTSLPGLPGPPGQVDLVQNGPSVTPAPPCCGRPAPCQNVRARASGLPASPPSLRFRAVGGWGSPTKGQGLRNTH